MVNEQESCKYKHLCSFLYSHKTHLLHFLLTRKWNVFVLGHTAHRMTTVNVNCFATFYVCSSKKWKYKRFLHHHTAHSLFVCILSLWWRTRHGATQSDEDRFPLKLRLWIVITFLTFVIMYFIEITFLKQYNAITTTKQCFQGICFHVFCIFIART